MLTPKSMTSRQKCALYPSYHRVESKDVSAETDEPCPLPNSFDQFLPTSDTDVAPINDIPKIPGSGPRDSPVHCTGMSQPPRMLEDVFPSTSRGTHVQEDNIHT
jgi:hypothetical protein